MTITLRSLLQGTRTVVGAARELRAHVGRVGEAPGVEGGVLDSVARVGDALTGTATRQDPAPASARRVAAPRPAPRCTAPRRAPSECEPGPVIDVPDADDVFVAPAS